jgi:hypothetical protein
LVVVLLSSGDTSRKPPRRPPTPAVAAARARHAGLTRHRGANHPQTREAAADLAEAQIAAWIARRLTEAPPLSAARRARLAGLLRGPDDGAGAA